MAKQWNAHTIICHDAFWMHARSFADNIKCLCFERIYLFNHMECCSMPISKVRIVRINGVDVSRSPQPMFTKPISRTCPHRGDQLRTMTSDLCGQRGHNLPVYSCQLHGECTHSKVCRGQDPAVKICIGCPDGPWAAD